MGIRTVVVVIALALAVLFLPLWVQLVLFVVAVWITPYQLALLVPAVFADALYSPTGHFSILHLMLTLKMAIVVGVLLLVRWLLVSYTRFGSMVGLASSQETYGLEA